MIVAKESAADNNFLRAGMGVAEMLHCIDLGSERTYAHTAHSLWYDQCALTQAHSNIQACVQ